MIIFLFVKIENFSQIYVIEEKYKRCHQNLKASICLELQLKKFKELKKISKKHLLKLCKTNAIEICKEKQKKKVIKKKNAILRNNAISGKSIENLLNKVDVKIVTTRKQ